MDADKLFNLSTLEDRDRINILMQEYSTLRAEIIARTGFGFQIAAISAAALTWLIQQRFWEQATSPLPRWAYFVLGFIALVIALLLRVNIRDTWKAAERVREIEYEVNSRAGEQLLIWESSAGAGRMNFWRSLISRVRRLPREKLPALDENYIERSRNKKLAGEQEQAL